MNPVILGLLAFILLQLGIGVLVSRKVRNEDDYLLAGRSLGPVLVCLSVFATWFGAETCISSASGLYENGLAGGAAEPFGYGLCIVLYGAAFALPLWKNQVTTLGDWFRQRYSPGIEKITASLLAITSLFWASAQIRAFGQVLTASTNIDVRLAILLAASVAVIYTSLGGLRADVITDVFQGGIIILGLLLLLALVLHDIGGPVAAWNAIDPARLNLLPPDVSAWERLETWLVPVFGSVTAQELAARSLAARSPQIARNATIAGGSLYILVGAIPAFLGLIAPVLLPELNDAEQVLPTLAQTYLPTFGYILFAGALISAILSTVDSSLLAASALITHNLLPKRQNHQPDDRQSLRLARIGVIVCGSLACTLALSADSIYDLVETSSSFGGAGLFILITLGMLSRRGGKTAAASTLIGAALTWILCSQIESFPAPYTTSLAVGLTCYLANVMISRQPA